MSKVPTKVVILGSSGVGKTSILLQIYKEKFFSNGEPTIGASYVIKTLQTKDGKLVEVHFCDTAGQERFKSIVPMYIRGSQAIILVCSVDDSDSIDNLESWYDLAKEHNRDFILYVLMNKCDLDVKDDNRAKEWAESKGAQFFKITAKEHESIEPFLEKLADDISKLKVELRKSDVTNVEETSERKSKCCS